MEIQKGKDGTGDNLPSKDKKTNMSNKVPAVKSDKGSINIVPKTISLDVVNNTEKALEFFAKLVETKNIGASTPEEALAVYIQAGELALPFVTSSNHMHIIKGKVGLDIHLIRAILLRTGNSIHWEHTKDYLPVYEFTDVNNKWRTTLTGQKFLNWLVEEYGNYYAKAEFAWSKGDFDSIRAKGGIAISTTSGQMIPVDFESEYVFTRVRRLAITNELKTLRVVGKFSYQDALMAGLYDPQGKGDSAWVKFTHNQCNIRAFTFGAREIADDLLNGCYETSELYDINGINYSIQNDQVIVEDADAIDISHEGMDDENIAEAVPE